MNEIGWSLQEICYFPSRSFTSHKSDSESAVRWGLLTMVLFLQRKPLIRTDCNSALFEKTNLSQTPLLRTPLGPEKVSVLQSVLNKRVNFKENVWRGTKKTVLDNKSP